MDIVIDTSSAEAVFEQIVRQVHRGAAIGALAPGQALPSIRQLAGDLDLNPNTVAKAYRILEADHVIRTAGQKGTFINDGAAEHSRRRSMQDAAYQLSALVRALQQKGMSMAAIEAAFRDAVNTHNQPEEQ